MKFLQKMNKLLLPAILLCLQSPVSKAQYCTISFNAGVEAMSLVDFAGITNATSNTSTTAYEDFTSLSASVMQGGTYPITVKGNTYGAYVDYFKVYIDWNQDNDFTGSNESYQIGQISNSTGIDAVQATANILVPVTAMTGTTRMRVVKRYGAYSVNPCGNNNYGQAEDYLVNVTAGNACTGTPVAGTVSSSVSSPVCANTAFNLTLTGYSSGTGIQIEWQYDDGGGWQPIAGATNALVAISGGISTPTSYRAVVTCMNGGAQDISNVLAFSINTPAQCYCAVTFSGGVEPITLVDFSNVHNQTTASVTGAPAYEDFTGMTATVLQDVTYPITVKAYTGGNYVDSVRVYIDWDQNGIFNSIDETYDLGSIINSTGTDAVQATANIYIPATSLTGTTRMRVTQKWAASAGPCNTGGYGQAEDYTVEILPTNSCLGVPTPGTASGPASVCANQSFSLTLNGYTISTGITMQWQYFDLGNNMWTDIPGATTSSYTVASGIASNTDFQAVVTCVNGGSQATSNIVSVATAPFYNCYCTPHNTSFGASIANVSILGTTLNNLLSGTGPAPDYYTVFPASGNTTADLMQGSYYTMDISFTTAAIASLWIDFNQDGTYDASEWTQVCSNATSAQAVFLVPSTAMTGLTGMRIRSRNAGGVNAGGDACTSMTTGETEEYLVNITPAVACSGMPVAGSIVAPAAICTATPFNLVLSGYTIENGIDIEWDYYDSGSSSWMPLPSSNIASYYVAGIANATDFRAVVTCVNTGQQAITNPVTVSITPPNQCYCTISFPGDVEPITLVDFAGINNTSADALSIPPQLEDFTAISGNVALSQSYPITVKCNTAGPYNNYIRVFIDWNQNGIFSDPGESTDLGFIYNSTGLDAVQATGNIAVPSGATLGSTRMRVTAKWSAYATECNSTGYGQAEDYTINVSQVLGIKLEDITAVNKGAVNLVSWKTAGEANGDRFELERSADGQSFHLLNTIPSEGKPSSYAYEDKHPFYGMNFYRLRMVDGAGNPTYSRIVTAVANDQALSGIQMFPNPATDILTIKISGQINDEAVIYLCDMKGGVLQKQYVTTHTLDIDISRFAPGSYLLKYVDGRQSSVLKFSKQ